MAAGAVVGGAIALQAAGSLLGSRAKKKARKRQRRLIRQALAQLTPDKINELAASLGAGIGESLGALGDTAAGTVGSAARAAGLDPTAAQSGLRSGFANAAPQEAFQTAMGLAPVRANMLVNQATQVQPNYQWADLANLASSGLSLYAGYKGLQGG